MLYLGEQGEGGGGISKVFLGWFCKGSSLTKILGLQFKKNWGTLYLGKHGGGVISKVFLGFRTFGYDF